MTCAGSGLSTHMDSGGSPLVAIARAIFAGTPLPPDAPGVALSALAGAETAALREDARGVLQFLLSTERAESVVSAVQMTLTELGHAPEVYQALTGVLESAAFWARWALNADTLVETAAMSHLAAYRVFLCERVIVPALFAAGSRAGVALVRKVHALYGESPSFRYLAYAIGQWRQFSGEVREWAAATTRDCFPWQAAARAKLSGSGRRILIVHNIADGQGDQMVRSAPLAQAFLDFNPTLQVALIAPRAYLYSHPRISVTDVANPSAIEETLQGRFDGVISFYESQITELNHCAELEKQVQEYRAAHRPFLFASATKGLDEGTFQVVEVDGNCATIGGSGSPNIYEPASRLIAELGLPLRCGEDEPAGGFVLAGVAWTEAEETWNKLVASYAERRPVALFNPFGGMEPLKGFVAETFAAAAKEVERLVNEGYFVVITPNGTAWGSAALAREIAGQQACVTIAPDPAGTPAARDSAMRRLLYFVRSADLVVTVEGWMMHAAFALGKPYRVLMAPYSQDCRWHPRLRSGAQDVTQPAGHAGLPVVEQPRKSIVRFLLRAANDHSMIQQALTSPDRDLRAAAAEGLGRFPGSSVTGELVRLLRDPCYQVRGAAAECLLRRPDAGVAQAELVAHAYIAAEDRAWDNIVRLGKGAAPAIRLACTDEDPVVRREAARAAQWLEFESQFQELRRSGGSKFRWGDLLRNWISPGRGAVDKKNAPAKVLVLTPVKNATAFLDGYFEQLGKLSYPADRISLGFLEGDSFDGTYEALASRLPKLEKQFRRAGLWKRDFGYQTPPGLHRGAPMIQAERRAVLARSRNHLLMHALDDEDWVLWLDVDVIEYPPDILERLLATEKTIVQPHCVLDYGGPSFDTNAWRDRGRLHLDDLRQEGDLVELDTVGATMLLVRADLHRDGLVFPAFPYGRASALMRGESGELETEGFGIMAVDMGHRCWGMPHLEIRHGRW